MKTKNRSVVRNTFKSTTILPVATLGLGLAVPVPHAHAVVNMEEVIVTARRTEESVQDVPISMTVFNQQALDDRNIISATDLVKFTPSLNVNTRFGSDQASFAIRGFTQEFRTTASVAVYFADVVAPRGGGSVTAGDGAGPGAFFDLQNVQVLKGPQGTLFGRNTTGGAIQLVPQEPANELEGYLELSTGNYDMRRAQGAISLPISDSVRARFGVDTMKRDGYMKNVSGIGPDRLSDIDYLAARASVIVELTDSLQNYTIATYTDSENRGTIQGLFICDPAGATGFLCGPTLASQRNDFYAVASDHPNPTSELKQWQLINTTTWEVNDDLAIKNILSFADLEQTTRGSAFGTNFGLALESLLGFPAGTPFSFYPVDKWPGVPTSSQTTFVEELQLSGFAMDELLTWQIGFYFENSRPDGRSGTLSPNFLSCQQPLGGDPGAWPCTDPFGQGMMNSQLGEIEYTNQAVYAQSTYDISDEFRLTTGLRYTVDKTEGTSWQINYPGVTGFSPTCALTVASLPGCRQNLDHKSEAPTWLLGLDYMPSVDLLLYAKYSRGYRQGSLNMFAAEGVQKYDSEQVDAYEIGGKWSFNGPVPGTFNIAAFYNELEDQQIQAFLMGPSAPLTTAIVNAGASTIQGIELDTTLELYEGLMFSLSYAYLDTALEEIALPQIAAGSPYDQIFGPGTGSLTFSPRHTLVAALNYRLPLRADIGEVTLGASYTYIDEQISYGDVVVGEVWLPSRELVNLNASWRGIFGTGLDLALFATNVTDDEYETNINGGIRGNTGMDFRVTGEPRMYGARLKYNF